jgi:hypothetical protein
MKNSVFWDVTPCDSCKKRRFGGRFRHHHQGEKNQQATLRQLLVTANFDPSSLILFALMMEAIGSSETWVLTRTTRRYIPEDGILHSHFIENLSSYMALTGWAL